MGSSSDYPVTPWMRNQARMDREDAARGVKPWTELDYLAEQKAKADARIAARRRRGTDHEDEHPIDPREVRY